MASTRARTTVCQGFQGVIRGFGGRHQRCGKPRLLRVERLEDRTLLSVAADGAEPIGFPATQVAAAPVADSIAAGAVVRPNLTPYRPAGWGDKIVVSNVTGTHSGGPLSTTDTLYVDWAGLNNGGRATSTVFYVRLFVDGALKNTWSVDPLNRNTYTFIEDFSIGQLGAGQHTIRIKLDTTKAVAENNELDNAYSKTITVTRPNLTPFRPTGWGDKIVVSNVTGTHAGTTLFANNTLYVDWAGLNNGKVPTAATFSAELYVDGALQNTWFFDPPLSRNKSINAEDFAIGPLSAGQHTIRVKLDTTQAVAETNEKDNVYTKTITVLPPVIKPNLTPYQPDGWSDKIVVSTSKGTNTDSTGLLSTDVLYIDWAVLNNGNAATRSQFTSQLYVDGILKQNFNTPAPLDVGSHAFSEDAAIGPLRAGTHTIQIRLDTGNTIAEINETDNVYTRTITVASSPDIAFVVHYTDSAGEGFFDPQLGAQRRGALEYALGIWSGLLLKSYEGETVTFEAAMNPMGGSQSGATLGTAGPKGFRSNFGAGRADTAYGDALANHLARRDLSPGVAEISAQFNSDVDNPTVLGSTSWYYGTDGASGNDMDFVSVILHEVGHGLNFLDLIDDATGGWSGFPGIYDRFLETGNGTDLTAMSNAGRRSAIVSDDLYWSGLGGRNGNGGVRPKMYAPNPYEPGSSVSHTDETVHENDLMSPTYSGPDHSPSAMDLGILADMGWNLQSGAASAVVLAPQASGGVASSWTPFGALIQEQYSNPSPLAAAALSGVGANRDWLAAIDRVLSDRDTATATVAVGRSAGDIGFHTRQPSMSVLAEHPTGWSRLASSEDRLRPWRDTLPRGHAGRFARNADLVFAGQEERHLGNRFPNGEVLDEGPATIGGIVLDAPPRCWVE